jgi:AAA+ superfamily predicted ATPase
MNEKESEFDALVKLHNEIKSFKIDKSAEILNKFQGINKNKFKLTAEEEEEGGPRLNLSSTTVCAYALSQYFGLWNEAGRDYKSKFGEPEDYYKFIIARLNDYLISNSENTSKLEAPDEFSLLNILPLLKNIQGNIKKDKYDFSSDNEVVCKIIKLLCDQFDDNRFSYGEKPHPFIYYKFLRIIDDWKNELVTCVEEVDKKDKGRDNNKHNKQTFDYFFTEAKIYDDAKYEMYRQIALYNAEDFSLFDVKRLIYSLLIVKLNDKYSNNLIKDKVLDLIFKEQLKTGLFPIGHVVNTDFVIEDGWIKDKNARIISANPLLSSVECLNDLLTHEGLKIDLEKYQKNLNSTYEWIIKRLRKDPSGNLLGWFPEYESAHTPESWLAGHTLVFLKKYCEMLSDLITKRADIYLQAKKLEELDITWDKLFDSYKIKDYVGRMMQRDKEKENKWVSNPDYRSALIFGPPGSGKSTIPEALAERLGWQYIVLTPGLFLSEGEQNIIPKLNEIFERLFRMKKRVIFFDEVDQLVTLRKTGTESSKWIVTALLPKLQKLWAQKEIKFILATNDITEVDPAITRSGRIDFVLPMGGTCWRARLKILINAIEDDNKKIKKHLNSEIFEDLLHNDKLKDGSQIDRVEKNDIKKSYLQNFLRRTDYLPSLEIQSIVEEIFNKKERDDDDLYKIFFAESGDMIRYFENSDFETFHEDLSSSLGSNIKIPVKIGVPDIADLIKNNIFRTG